LSGSGSGFDQVGNSDGKLNGNFDFLHLVFAQSIATGIWVEHNGANSEYSRFFYIEAVEASGCLPIVIGEKVACNDGCFFAFDDGDGFVWI